MKSSSQHLPGAFFALIALLLGFLPHVVAQNPGGYPEWVTNDYNCVIGCLQIFNETVKERPYPAGETQAYNCVTTTCNKETMAMNIYQTQYIISMFYATGSIYEDPNMGTWTSVPNFFGSSSTNGGAAAATATNNATATKAETLTTTNAAGQAQTTTRHIGAPIASTSSPAVSGGANGTTPNGGEGVNSGAMRDGVVVAWALAAAVALSVAVTGDALFSS